MIRRYPVDVYSDSLFNADYLFPSHSFDLPCTMSMRYASARDILLIASTQRANHAYAPCAIAKARKNSERTRTRRKLVRARVVAFFVLYVFILIVATSHNPFRENGDRHLLAMVQYLCVDFI